MAKPAAALSLGLCLYLYLSRTLRTYRYASPVGTTKQTVTEHHSKMDGALQGGLADAGAEQEPSFPARIQAQMSRYLSKELYFFSMYRNYLNE